MFPARRVARSLVHPIQHQDCLGEATLPCIHNHFRINLRRIA